MKRQHPDVSVAETHRVAQLGGRSERCSEQIQTDTHLHLASSAALGNVNICLQGGFCLCSQGRRSGLNCLQPFEIKKSDFASFSFLSLFKHNPASSPPDSSCVKKIFSIVLLSEPRLHILTEKSHSAQSSVAFPCNFHLNDVGYVFGRKGFNRDLNSLVVIPNSNKRLNICKRRRERGGIIEEERSINPELLSHGARKREARGTFGDEIRHLHPPDVISAG